MSSQSIITARMTSYDSPSGTRRTTVKSRINPYMAKRRSIQCEGTKTAVKCQAWKTEVLSIDRNVYSTRSTVNKKKLLKNCYPKTHREYQYFCPACDLYFKSYTEYQNHLIIQSFIAPYKQIIAAYYLIEKPGTAEIRDLSDCPSKRMRKSVLTPKQNKVEVGTYNFGPKTDYDTESMLEKLKEQRTIAMKIRKKSKLNPIRMSKRHLSRRGTILPSLESKTDLERTQSVIVGNIPERTSKGGRSRTTVVDRMSVKRQSRATIASRTTLAERQSIKQIRESTNRASTIRNTIGPRNARLSLLVATKEYDE